MRPNILLFITDQHRFDYLGCAGHPVLKTPHIDSIAARGTFFTRFYVATPVCMPNRATLMTGRMPSVHGVRSNGSPLSLFSNTFVDALRAGGYATALVGKSHLQNFGPYPPVLKRPPPRPGDAALDQGFAEARKPVPGDGPYDQEHPRRWQAGHDFAMQLPFYGFDHVDLCTAHGDRSADTIMSGSRPGAATPMRCAIPAISCRTITCARRRSAPRSRRSFIRPPMWRTKAANGSRSTRGASAASPSF